MKVNGWLVILVFILSIMLMVVSIMLIFVSARRAGAQGVDCREEVNVPLTQYNGSLARLTHGFCIDGYYFPRLLSEHWWLNTVPPTHLVTRFLYQDPGVMEATAFTHKLELDTAQDFVALYSASTRGFKMWIRPNAAAAWTPVRQADTNALPHVQYHVEVLSSGFEVGWETAQAWGIPAMKDDPRGLYLWDAEICITESDPVSVCADEPTHLETWFSENAEYE